MVRGLVVLAMLAACGSHESPPPDGTPHPDGTPADARPDAMPSTVMEVSCAGVTPAATIGTSGLAFSPTTATLTAGDILQFTPSGTHNMTADDGAFATTTGQIACLQFTAPGSFPFHCSVHPSMQGTVTVN